MRTFLELLRKLPLKSMQSKNEIVLHRLRLEASEHSSEACVLKAFNLLMPDYLTHIQYNRPAQAYDSLETLRAALYPLIADISHQLHDVEQIRISKERFEGLLIFLDNLQTQINYHNLDAQAKSRSVNPDYLDRPEDLKLLCELIFLTANLIKRRFNTSENELSLVKHCETLFESVAVCGPGAITHTTELLNDLVPENGLSASFDAFRRYCLPSALISRDAHLQILLSQTLGAPLLVDDPFRPHDTPFVVFLKKNYPSLLLYNYFKAAKTRLPQSLAIQIMQMFSEQDGIRSKELPTSVRLLSELQLIEEGWEFKLSESKPEEMETIAIEKGRLVFLHRDHEESLLMLHYHDGSDYITRNLSAGEGSSHTVINSETLDFLKTKPPFQTLTMLSDEELGMIDTLAEIIGLEKYKKGDEGAQLYNEDYTKFSLNIDRIPAIIEVTLERNQPNILPKAHETETLLSNQGEHPLTLNWFKNKLEEVIYKKLFEADNFFPSSILSKASFVPFINELKDAIPDAFQNRLPSLSEILCWINPHPEGIETVERTYLLMQYYLFITPVQTIVNELLLLTRVEQDYFFSLPNMIHNVLTEETFWQYLKQKITDNPTDEAWKNLRDSIIFGDSDLFFSLSFRMNDVLECFFGESAWVAYTQFDDAAPLVFYANFRSYYQRSCIQSEQHDIRTHPAACVARIVYKFYYEVVYQKLGELCNIDKRQYFFDEQPFLETSRNFQKQLLPRYVENFSQTDVNSRLRNQITSLFYGLLHRWNGVNHHYLSDIQRDAPSVLRKFRDLYRDGFNILDPFTTYIENSEPSFQAQFMQTPIQSFYNLPAWLFLTPRPLFSPNQFHTISNSLATSGFQNCHVEDDFFKRSQAYLDPDSTLELIQFFEQREADFFLLMNFPELITLAVSSQYAYENQWINSDLRDTVFDWLTEKSENQSYARLAHLCHIVLCTDESIWLRSLHNYHLFMELISLITANTRYSFSKLLNTSDLLGSSNSKPSQTIFSALLKLFSNQNYAHTQLLQLFDTVSLSEIMAHEKIRITIDETIQFALIGNNPQTATFGKLAQIFSDPDRLTYLSNRLHTIFIDELKQHPLEQFKPFVRHALSLILNERDSIKFLQITLKQAEISEQIKPIVCEYLHENAWLLHKETMTPSAFEFCMVYITPAEYLYNLLNTTKPDLKHQQVQKLKQFFKTEFFTNKLSRTCDIETLFHHLFLSEDDCAHLRVNLNNIKNGALKEILFLENPLLTALRKRLFLGSHAKEVSQNLFESSANNDKPLYQSLLTQKKVTPFEKFLCSNHEEANSLRQSLYTLPLESRQDFKNFIEPLVQNSTNPMRHRSSGAQGILPLIECIFSENPVFLEELLDKSLFRKLIKTWVSGKPELIFGLPEIGLEPETSLNKRSRPLIDKMPDEDLLPSTRKRGSGFVLESEEDIAPPTRFRIFKPSEKKARATAPLWPKPENRNTKKPIATNRRFFHDLDEDETLVNKRQHINADSTCPTKTLECFKPDQIIRRFSQNPSLLECCITSHHGLQWLRKNHGGQEISAALGILDIVEKLWDCFSDKKNHMDYNRFSFKFTQCAFREKHHEIEEMDGAHLRSFVVEAADSIENETLKAILHALESPFDSACKSL